MAGKFEYTDNSHHLTDDQRRFYEENGYLIIRNLVNHGLLDECRQRFLDIINGRAPRDSKMSIMKDVNLMKSGKAGEYMYYKINDILYDDVFFKYVSDQKIVDTVTSIIGYDTIACHSAFINQPPDAARGAFKHPLHQDLHYLPFRPANRIVTSCTALERIDPQNGCLFGIPGSHKRQLYPHTAPDNVKTPAIHGVHTMKHTPLVNFVLEKGDTIFFHPMLLHGSGPNFTKGSGRRITVHYADSNSDFVGVTGTRQKKIDRDGLKILSRQGYVVANPDLHYLPFRPANRIVTSCTALERIDAQNGCLFGIPGSHKRQVNSHTAPDNVKTPAIHGVHTIEHTPLVNFVLEKGDTIFFHPMLLHGSGPNFTEGSGERITVHYADSNSDFVGVTGTGLKNIDGDGLKIVSRQGYVVANPDVGKLRLVSGRPGNFQKMTSKF